MNTARKLDVGGLPKLTKHLEKMMNMRPEQAPEAEQTQERDATDNVHTLERGNADARER